jgi:hypothetical protein
MSSGVRPKLSRHFCLEVVSQPPTRPERATHSMAVRSMYANFGQARACCLTTSRHPNNLRPAAHAAVTTQLRKSSLTPSQIRKSISFSSIAGSRPSGTPPGGMVADRTDRRRPVVEAT